MYSEGELGGKPALLVNGGTVVNGGSPVNGVVKVNIGELAPPSLKAGIKASEVGTELPDKQVELNGNAVPPGADDNDPWALPELSDQGVKWSELTSGGKLCRVAVSLIKLTCLIGLLYIFICSLDFLKSAFQLIGGRAAGKVMSQNELLRNPVVGLMIGVLVTVVVQSSSTSTSIVVTMVGSDLLSVSQAIPLVMGANIGTSVTNTIVSLMQATDRNEFRRAFAAATVHDMFNWLTVIILLPIEVWTGYLEKLTDAIISSGDWKTDKNANKQFLTVLTKPLTSRIIQLDKKVTQAVAGGKEVPANVTLLKRCCKYLNGTSSECEQPCNFLFADIPWSDSFIGLLMLVISIALLCTCLVLMVKLLHSMLRGRIVVILKKTVNAEYKFPYSIIVGYIAILVGCVMTILVQSSSIFTSALTPLAGIGVLSLERIYPLTLGSNIGTTTTAILAALAAEGGKLRYTLQLAFCHLFFNITGILLFYPIPFMRFPIGMAKALGNTTAKYRWFSIFYLVSMFLLLPAAVFGLSMAGTAVFIAVGAPIVIVVLLVVVVNVIQNKRPGLLPPKFQNWNWLPEFMHSLDPLDRQIGKLTTVCRCCKCCIQPQTCHDADALGIRPNQSQINILANQRSSSHSSECHLMNGYDNTAYTWNGMSKKSEVTKL